jgi:hypothetical protein
MVPSPKGVELIRTLGARSDDKMASDPKASQLLAGG